MYGFGKKRLLLLVLVAALVLIFYSNLQVNRIKDNSAISQRTYNSKDENSFLDEQSSDNSTAQHSVLCVVLTSDESIKKKGDAAWNTWARRCKKTYYACNCLGPEVSTRPDGAAYHHDRLPLLLLDTKEDYNNMGAKCLKILQLIYELHRNEFNWFLINDDDTFIFVTNLYRFIQDKDCNEPVTYGYNFKKVVDSGYHSGGGGILLTRESLRRLYVSIVNKKCEFKEKYGDLAIGFCAEASHVRMGNSLDSQGRERFHTLSAAAHYWNLVPDWLHAYSQNGVRIGEDCCSDETISFHYVSSEEMYLLGLFSKIFE